MSRRPIVLASAVILISALAGSAAARTPPQGGGIQGLPRHADEVQPWTERLFVRIDVNRDGAITEDELAVLDNPQVAAMRGSRIRAMIMGSDTDGDARITLEELTAGTQVMFERMNAGAGRPPGIPASDVMGEGVGADMLSLPRTADAVISWAERLFTRLDANQNGNITGDELAILANPTVAAMGGSRLRAMIAQSDASRDSRISAEEMIAGAQRMFTRMDLNGDGRLSDTELPRPPAPPPPITIPAPEPDMPFPDMPNGG